MALKVLGLVNFLFTKLIEGLYWKGRILQGREKKPKRKEGWKKGFGIGFQ